LNSLQEQYEKEISDLQVSLKTTLDKRKGMRHELRESKNEREKANTRILLVGAILDKVVHEM